MEFGFKDCWSIPYVVENVNNLVYGSKEILLLGKN